MKHKKDVRSRSCVGQEAILLSFRNRLLSVRVAKSENEWH